MRYKVTGGLATVAAMLALFIAAGGSLEGGTGTPTPTPTATVTATPTAAPDGLANVWIVPGAGSCARATVAVTLAASSAPDYRCGSILAAITAGQANDVVRCTSGTYGDTSIPSSLARPGMQVIGDDGCTIVDRFDVDTPDITFDNIDVDGNGIQATLVEFNGNADGSVWKNGEVRDNVNTQMITLTARDMIIDNMVFRDAVHNGLPGVHMECIWAADVGGLTLKNSTFQNCAIFDIAFTYGDWWVPQPPAYNDVLIENNVFSCSRVTNSTGNHSEGSLAIGSNGPAQVSEPLVNWRIRYNSVCDMRISDDDGDRVATGNSEMVGNIGGITCLEGFDYHHNVGSTCGGSNSVATSPCCYDSSGTEPTYWINEPLNDLRLSLGSPGIGAGDPTDHPTTDRNGVTRGNPPDAGALERED